MTALVRYIVGLWVVVEFVVLAKVQLQTTEASGHSSVACIMYIFDPFHGSPQNAWVGFVTGRRSTRSTPIPFMSLLCKYSSPLRINVSCRSGYN